MTSVRNLPRPTRRSWRHIVALAIAAGSLGAAVETASTAPADPAIDDDALVAAARGLGLYLVENMMNGANDGPCPIVTHEQLVELAAHHHLDAPTGELTVGVNTAGAAYCGTDLDGPAEPDHPYRHAFALSAALHEPTYSLSLHFDGVANVTVRDLDGGIGGEIGGSCDSHEPRTCGVAWRGDYLVFTLWLVGPAADTDQPTAEAFLVDVIPQAIATLGSDAPSWADAATTSPRPAVAPSPTASPTPPTSPTSPTSSTPPTSSPAPPTSSPAPPTSPPPPAPTAPSSVEPVPFPVPEPVTTTAWMPEPVTTTTAPVVPHDGDEVQPQA